MLDPKPGPGEVCGRRAVGCVLSMTSAGQLAVGAERGGWEALETMRPFYCLAPSYQSLCYCYSATLHRTAGPIIISC